MGGSEWRRNRYERPSPRRGRAFSSRQAVAHYSGEIAQDSTKSFREDARRPRREPPNPLAGRPGTYTPPGLVSAELRVISALREPLQMFLDVRTGEPSSPVQSARPTPYHEADVRL